MSDEASAIHNMAHDAWLMFVDSIAVRNTAETSIGELKRAMRLASKPNWDGYGASVIDERAIIHSIRFLQALPTTMPAPSVSVDPDGEVDLLWHVDNRRTFSVSVGAAGRLTYSGLFGTAQSYGTEWLDDEIPPPILLNLARVLEPAV